MLPGNSSFHFTSHPTLVTELIAWQSYQQHRFLDEIVLMMKFESFEVNFEVKYECVGKRNIVQCVQLALRAYLQLNSKFLVKNA